MHTYFNVYTSCPWEFKYGGRFDLCALHRGSAGNADDLSVNEILPLSKDLLSQRTFSVQSLFQLLVQTQPTIIMLESFRKHYFEILSEEPEC